jgi:hypothetical protein
MNTAPASIVFELLYPLSKTYSVLTLIGHTKRVRSSVSFWKRQGSHWINIVWSIGVRVCKPTDERPLLRCKGSSTMALVRCERCGRPQGMKLRYAHRHKIASTKSRIFCGTGNCTDLAIVCWLTDVEKQEYISGERRFAVPFRGMVRVA